MGTIEQRRLSNPFHDPLVSELLEDPASYRKMFSEEILVGETLQAFKPTNTVVMGPQGCGKSMILNLIRTEVLAEWIKERGRLPKGLKHCPPFLGISINLARTGFHAFGRRSVSRVQDGVTSEDTDSVCAADFITHFLFGEFLNTIRFLQSSQGAKVCQWMGVRQKSLDDDRLLIAFRKLGSWYEYYRKCRTLTAVARKCRKRLDVWRDFLNANIKKIPPLVWRTKAAPEQPLHAIGKLLAGLSHRRLRLFAIIDQYEVLPELNLRYGTKLQRIVNNLIKARDPFVFYKLGARTHDWGRELRVWGASSRIEETRDYALINLTDLLMREENLRRWLFPRLATDVAHKRIRYLRKARLTAPEVPGIFGPWSAEKEAEHYFGGGGKRKSVVLREVPKDLRARLQKVVGPGTSAVELRLAGAWILQRLGRGDSHRQIAMQFNKRPWRRWSWKKERIGVALMQVASMANQKKRCFGWKALIYLSGGNISAFLLLCSEIWDMCCRQGDDPIKHRPIDVLTQTNGVEIASGKWYNRDRNENTGGSRRFAFLSRLGPAIQKALKSDLAISNPGQTGFSLRESDLRSTPKGLAVLKFLENGVNWAILEERPHTSKLGEASRRRKFFLHPLLCAYFQVPFVRAKEPYYVSVEGVHGWVFDNDPITFGSRRRPASKPSLPTRQMTLFEEKSQ